MIVCTSGRFVSHRFAVHSFSSAGNASDFSCSNCCNGYDGDDGPRESIAPWYVEFNVGGPDNILVLVWEPACPGDATMFEAQPLSTKERVTADDRVKPHMLKE